MNKEKFSRKEILDTILEGVDESAKDILDQIAKGATEDELYAFIWNQQLSEREAKTNAIEVEKATMYIGDEGTEIDPSCITIERAVDIKSISTDTEIERLEAEINSLHMREDLTSDERKALFYETKNKLIELNPGICVVCKEKETVDDHFVLHNLPVSYVMGHRACLETKYTPE